MTQKTPDQRKHNPVEQGEGDQVGQIPDPQSPGTRQYESGRNPDMQVQRTNRQGDGNPTQQRQDDR